MLRVIDVEGSLPPARSGSELESGVYFGEPMRVRVDDSETAML